MTVYAVAQLTIHDRATYDRYLSRFLDVIAPYDAAVLAADDNPVVTEGPWVGDRVVLLAFSDRDEFDQWANSDEYQEIAQDRLASASTTVLVVKGLHPWPTAAPAPTAPTAP